MILLIAGAVIAWLAIGVWLSSFMARRGYDRTAWLVVGLLFGPVTLFFATVELAWAIPRPPQTVERGRLGPGSVNLLAVLVDHDLAPVRETLNAIGDGVHRLVLAQVLPFDGAKAAETAAASELHDHAAALVTPWAELALVFGIPARAISALAMQGGFSVVVTDRDVPALAASLHDAGIVLLADHAAVRRHFQSPVDRPHLTVVDQPRDVPSWIGSPRPEWRGLRTEDSTTCRSTRSAGRVADATARS